MNIQTIKNKFRLEATEKIRALPPAERSRKSREIADRVLQSDIFKETKTILLYAASPLEVNTTFLMQTCLDQGKTLAIPCLDLEKKEAGMRAIQISDLENDLEIGPWKMVQPKTGLPALSLESIDLIILPGRAFDKKGNRLGRGKGHYDQFLEKVDETIPTLGLAFDCQLFDEIPTEPHDKALNFICTETSMFQI